MAARINSTEKRFELYDQILFSLLTGRKQVETKERLKCSSAMVSAVSVAYAAVSRENGPDWEELVKICERYDASWDLIDWAGEKARVEVPPSVLLEIQVRAAQKKAAKKATKEAPVVQDAPEAGPEPQEGPAAPPPAPDHWEDEKVLLQSLIMAVKEQNELLEQLYDAVLPKWIGDLKDNHNANSDVQTQALKRIEDKLEAIKINVRRRGA